MELILLCILLAATVWVSVAGMNWRLILRALWLRGGILWLVAGHYRLMPRRLPGPRFLTRWAIKVNAKRQGRRDGKLGLPTAEQMSAPRPDYPAHLMYLKNQGDRFVRAILESMQNIGSRRRGRSAAFGQVRQLLNRANDERAGLADFQRKLDVSKNQLERREGDLAHSHEELALAKERRRRVDVWSRGLSRSTYSVLLVFFTVAELPLLALAFQNFFSVFFSVIVSLGVSVAIIFFAHVAGILLVKRESEPFPRDAPILGAIWIGVVSTIIGLSVVRELYLKTNEQVDGLSTGPTWVVVLVFAIFNFMVFGAAVLLSKVRHSEHAEAIDDAKRAVRRAGRDIERARKSEMKLRKQVARIQERIILLDGLAWGTTQRIRSSVDQAQMAAASRKDFIEKCYALYVRENTRSQAYGAARRARLPQPLESGPVPFFNHLPEVKNPADEFRPLKSQVHKELLPLEKQLRHVATATGGPETNAINGMVHGTDNNLAFGDAPN
jgi:hypothetical protein